MRSTTGGAGARVGIALAVASVIHGGCATPPTPKTPGGAAASSASAPPPATTAATTAEPARVWPEALAGALAGRGDPHAQPVALPRDARGRARWLAFVGTREVAWGAWRVTRAEDGTTEVDPVERWPAGVRVVGAVVDGGVAYVLLESVEALDQPAGLRAAWVDAWMETGGPTSRFEASPMALSDVRTVAELAARVASRGASVHAAVPDAGGLLAALRAATASATTLASALAREGADVRLAWQSLFTQQIGHLDAETAASSLLAGSVLAVMRDALATQACGLDACEAWTDGARAVVRFVRQDGRWAVSSVIEDAPASRYPARASPPRQVPAAPDATEMESLLRTRARQVHRVLGQAPLTPSATPDAGTIGVGLTDLSPDTPVIAVREGNAVRVFTIDAGAVRAEGDAERSDGAAHQDAHQDAHPDTWDAAFADVDGDGRTDVVLRWSGTGAGGVALSWTQAFLAPPPSVQVASLAPDLATSLALMDARDVDDAARAAVSVATMATGGVSREDACRLLADASTPAGFRKQAAADARLLHFDEPGMPTWRPKVIPAGKVVLDDLRGIGEHCAELTCSATRPYCAWIGGADSEHLWFGWRAGRPEIVGVASYEGE